MILVVVGWVVLLSDGCVGGLVAWVGGWLVERNKKGKKRYRSGGKRNRKEGGKRKGRGKEGKLRRRAKRVNGTKDEEKVKEELNN